LVIEKITVINIKNPSSISFISNIKIFILLLYLPKQNYFINYTLFLIFFQAFSLKIKHKIIILCEKYYINN